MKTEMTKDLKKRVDKYGSVLAAFRSQGGGGKGLMAGGIMLLVCGVLFGGVLMFVKVVGGIVVFAVFAFPGLAMFVPGMVLDKNRQAGYLEYYQKQTGYSLEELREAEAAAEAAAIIAAAPPTGGADIMEINTEKSMELRKSVRQFAQNNPEIAAQMVKAWLKGEDTGG